MSNSKQPTAGAGSPESSRLALLPCQISCPKCGASDIARVFRQRLEKWFTNGVERVRTNRFVNVDRLSGLCLEDVITQHCRVCRWDWETPPLATLARQEAARMIEEAVAQRRKSPPKTTDSGSNTCTACNWTNVSLLNLGEPGNPLWVCHGCCKKAYERTDKYQAILAAVARKFQGESRHETALRYIQETETRALSGGPCQSALTSTTEGGR